MQQIRNFNADVVSKEVSLSLANRKALSFRSENFKSKKSVSSGRSYYANAWPMLIGLGTRESCFLAVKKDINVVNIYNCVQTSHQIHTLIVSYQKKQDGTWSKTIYTEPLKNLGMHLNDLSSLTENSTTSDKTFVAKFSRDGTQTISLETSIS